MISPVSGWGLQGYVSCQRLSTATGAGTDRWSGTEATLAVVRVVLEARDYLRLGRGRSAGRDVVLHVLAVLGGEVGGGLDVRVGLDDFLRRMCE